MSRAHCEAHFRMPEGFVWCYLCVVLGQPESARQWVNISRESVPADPCRWDFRGNAVEGSLVDLLSPVAAPAAVLGRPAQHYQNG